METISANSKRGRHFVEAYEKSTKRSLHDAYAKPSASKRDAFKRCQQKCEAENGDHLKIISAGRQFFTVAFEVQNMFGAAELRVITKEHDYLIIFGTTL